MIIPHTPQIPPANADPEDARRSPHTLQQKQNTNPQIPKNIFMTKCWLISDRHNRGTGTGGNHSRLTPRMGNNLGPGAMASAWTRQNQPLLLSRINPLVIVAANVKNHRFNHHPDGPIQRFRPILRGLHRRGLNSLGVTQAKV